MPTHTEEPLANAQFTCERTQIFEHACMPTHMGEPLTNAQFTGRRTQIVVHACMPTHTGEPLTNAQFTLQMHTNCCTRMHAQFTLQMHTNCCTRMHAHRSALARVAVINEHGNVLLDVFVKQKEKVTDYRFAHHTTHTHTHTHTTCC